MTSSSGLFRVPTLTKSRIRLAYAAAIAADAAQFLIGPLGWIGTVQVIDVATMMLTWRLIGFHVLLLPTFLLELLPVAGMLPTWTGCVAVVIGLRKALQEQPPRASDLPPESDVHDESD